MTDRDEARDDVQHAVDDMKGRIKETARVFFRADESDRADDASETTLDQQQHQDRDEPDRDPGSDTPS